MDDEDYLFRMVMVCVLGLFGSVLITLFIFKPKVYMDVNTHEEINQVRDMR